VWTDLLAGRCPWCRRGRVFRGWLAMNETCPACGGRFEKEPGYFVGAMYFSYFLAVPTFALVVLLFGRLLADRPQSWSFAAALVVFIPMGPLFYRASRLLWLYFDAFLQNRRR
jgi:uncharacterized protein (DUF983 family)